MDERLGIAGSGKIASGLAGVAAQRGEVVMWARSEGSAKRARAAIEKVAGDDAASVRVDTDPGALDEATFVIEAIVEDHDEKTRLLAQLGRRVGSEAVLATTTSSLSVPELARASSHPHRFVGFHVFNPVHKMPLVELAFPDDASADTRARAHALCEALDKTGVEVPSIPGFVVNRLLFPYLFSAVRLLETTGLDPEQIDTCMQLGASHPMGPLALLDFVGLDVAAAIGRSLDIEVPTRLRALEAEGALGKKSGRGFHRYD